MPLLASLARDTGKADLGSHETLVLTFDELQLPDGKLLARFRHNRWLHAKGNDPFVRLDIAGPLEIRRDAQTRPYGPYEDFSTFDGVGYVDRRVFAFADLQHRDWYVHDAAEHWPKLIVVFHATGP